MAVDDYKEGVTQCGFKYGPVLVERLASHKGYRFIAIRTSKHRLELTITPSGLIRIGKPVRNLEQ